MFDINPYSYGSQTTHEASREQLEYRNISFELELSDNRGREAHISFDFSQLDYSRTYSKSSVAQVEHLGVGPRAQQVTTDSALAQSAYVEHQEVHATSLEFAIEGDMSLVADRFGVENTAQNIFDYVSGLVDHVAGELPRSDAIEQITAGVAEGFAAAEAILGGLPEISQQTQNILDLMLAAFADGEAASDIRAIDFMSEEEEA